MAAHLTELAPCSILLDLFIIVFFCSFIWGYDDLPGHPVYNCSHSTAEFFLDIYAKYYWDI